VGLQVTGGMRPSDTVLVTAAAGGTGHFAVQLAKRMGCVLTPTRASPPPTAPKGALRQRENRTPRDWADPHPPTDEEAQCAALPALTSLSLSAGAARCRVRVEAAPRSPALTMAGRCHVVGTCGGAAKVAALRELGCDRIIDHTVEDVGRVLKTEYPDGIDLVYEGVGGAMLETALENLAEEGRLLVVGYISEYPHKNAESGRPAASAATIAEGLFWSGDTVMRGKQTIRGNVWPKGDRQVPYPQPRP
jgi:hypothetical protein